MKNALGRTKNLIDPPIYLPPMKRWKRLSPYLAGLFWIGMACVCIYAYALSNGAI